MGVAASNETETRALYDEGGERLVILATELFRFVPDDLVGAVGGIAADWELPAGQQLVKLDLPATTGPGVVAFGYQPLDATRQAVPIADAFIQTADTSVLRLQMFVSPNATDDPDGLVALATGILRTLTIGPRALVAAAGTRTLTDLDDRPALTVEVPQGWVAYVEKGISFVVLRLVRMMPLGGTFGSVTVYRGGHPAPRQRDFPAESITRVDGTLLGQPAEWAYMRAEGSRPVYTREALVADGDRYVHAVAETDEPALNVEIDGILAAVRRA